MPVTGVNRHPYQSDRLTVSPSHGVAVTPSDTDELAHYSLGVSVAAAGNIAGVTMDDDEVTFYVAAGVMFPVRLKQIKATDTTATGIVAWD